MSFPFTPQPPHWHVDWPAIREAFAWIRDMAGVQQEPEFHAEGDVLVHTQMVAQAMAADPAWQACDADRRDRLFRAALLHDVAKPQCTRLEEGRWRSPRHAKVGERAARGLLWSGQAGTVPRFAQREAIARLVRYHGLPLNFLNKPDPQRAIIEASLQVVLEDVAILAMADVRGRRCAGQAELVEKVQLFCEYAQEQACFRSPWAFESDHHRFMYCAGQKPLEYVPFDKSRFTVTLMSGLPASGKSTWARANAGPALILCLDQLRQGMRIAPDEEQGQVITAAREQAKELLREHRDFIWDATNITQDLRSGLVALFANYGARVRIVYVESAWGEMWVRNRTRKEPVPEAVMHRLIDKLEIPSPSEAHDVRYVVDGADATS